MSEFDQNQNNSQNDESTTPKSQEPHQAQNSSSQSSQSSRQNAESMDLVRKRRERMLNHKPSTSPKLPLGKKIAGISIAFAFVVVGYWVLKDDDYLLDGGGLPVITAESSVEGEEEFKEAPTKEDIITSPHSDKTFYSELDQSQQSNTPTNLRKLPEDPSPQVSQQAMMVEADSSDAKIDMADALKSQETSVEQPGTSSDEVTVAVVDEAKTEPVKQPSKQPEKPHKTLEMAIRETSQNLQTESNILAQDDTIEKHQVRTPNDHLKIVDKDSDTPKAPSVAALKSTQNSDASMSSKTTGAYWVQVAALTNENSAVTEAKRIEGKANGHLDQTKRRTVRVDLGKPKGIKYRVQYGPYAKQGAVDACKTLKSQDGIGCFVVRG